MRIRVIDRQQRFDARVEVTDPYLSDIASLPEADALLGCAVHAVLAALAAGAAWSHDLTVVLADFMWKMREQIRAEHAA